jgi:hypothetical protein
MQGTSPKKARYGACDDHQQRGMREHLQARLQTTGGLGLLE